VGDLLFLLALEESVTPDDVSSLFSSSLQPLFDPASHLGQASPAEDEETAQGDTMFVPSPTLREEFY
jgi:hypothetical protein